MALSLISSDDSAFDLDDPGARLRTRLNWLRAGVLGASDGLTSIAGLVMGVAVVTESRSHLLVAGVAGLVAGSASMATGEYVSVSTQRDAEQALGDGAEETSNPVAAALASFLAFAVGALIPALTILLSAPLRFYATAAVVATALAGAGWISARLSRTDPRRPVLRTVGGGLVTLGLAFGAGLLLDFL
ncbi:MAG: VIT1/CCC1 transporter family protein [Nocardioides sp.]|uniref:VIT1/CCC1 transporter family protein n=1 Tax=Nocardioides sp. TaxID=35761 RepID=UPI0039E2F1CF